MGDDKDLEAADWHARLRTRSVGNAELAAFARWRKEPGNAEAYRKVERFWDETGDLSDDRDIRAATTSALRRPRYGLRPLAALAGATTVAVVLLLGIWALVPSISDPRLRTEVGERSKAVLGDGTAVVLDGDSEMTVRLRPDVRTVTISRGQALFSVRHDPARPFVVEAPSGISVTALGTRFDVRIGSGGEVGVALLEGRVAVRRSGRLLATLSPGDELVARASGGVEVKPSGAVDAVGWTQGRIVFRGSTLRDAVAVMNRHALVPISIGVASRGDDTISGEFSASDPDGFVDGVNALLGAGTVGADAGVTDR